MKYIASTHGAHTPCRSTLFALGRLAIMVMMLSFASMGWATETDCDGNEQDTSGYMCTQHPSGVIPDISASGTAVSSWSPKSCSGDDCYKLINFTSATFTWYGSTYSSVYIGSNGYISFNQGYTNPADTLSIPAAGDPNNAVYAYGDDLDPSDADSTGDVRYQETPCLTDNDSDGTNDDCFVVQWTNIVPYGGAAGDRVTVQVALNFATNRALVEIDADPHVDKPRVVGTENSGGSSGLWFKGAGDPDSRDASSTTYSRFTFGESAPSVTSVTPTDDSTGVALGADIVFTFDEPMNTGSNTLTVVSGTNPGGWVPTWSNGDQTLTYTHNDFSDSQTMELQLTAQDLSGNNLTAASNGVTGCAGNAFCFNFDTIDTTAPSNVSKVTSSSGDSSVTSNWVNPSSDYSGTLVVRRAAAAVNAAPTDGTTYTPGDSLGSGNDVVCVTSGVTASCADTSVTNGTVYYYKAFAFDASKNYAGGVEIQGFPRATTNFKWAYTTSASVLAPSGTIAGTYVVTAGNDRLVHRMAEADGARGSWEPPVLGGNAQARPMVGDINPGGAADNVAFINAQDGYVYRYGLSDGVLDGSRNATGDAGCSSGLLQGSPAIMLNAYDSNSNADDDVVIVGTRCGAADNKVLIYDHALSGAPLDTYDGDEDGDGTGADLGIINGAPKIYYRDSANNLVYVPVRSDGADGESLLVLSVGAGPTIESPVYSETTGLGDIDTTPEVFTFGTGTDVRVVFGSTAGVIYYYDGINRTGGASSPLVQKDTYTPSPSDGAVKAVSVSGRVPNGSGGFDHWVVWSTDGKVHGIRASNGGAELTTSTYWSATVAGASAPLVLRNVDGSNNTVAYVGSSDGNLYELNATDGSVLRSWTLESGKTIGDPTFDYNTGSNQGVVAGSSSGAIHWVKIN